MGNLWSSESERRKAFSQPRTQIIFVSSYDISIKASHKTYLSVLLYVHPCCCGSSIMDSTFASVQRATSLWRHSDERKLLLFTLAAVFYFVSSSESNAKPGREKKSITMWPISQWKIIVDTESRLKIWLNNNSVMTASRRDGNSRSSQSPFFPFPLERSHSNHCCRFREMRREEKKSFSTHQILKSLFIA